MGVVKERPILFNTEMVRAVLAGRKTQTRRVIKDTGTYAIDSKVHGSDVAADREKKNLIDNKSPYGQVGDRLWVRETHTFDEAAPNGVMYRADLPEDDAAAADVIEVYKGLWKPSIFMKREFSRILLEVINIRVERVKDISQKDALAEGCPLEYEPTPLCWFCIIWEKINFSRGFGWKSNPWVWVVDFKVIENHGEEEGDTCNRNGCVGVLEYSQVEECYCHINPPCNNCVENPLVCPECGYEEGEHE